MLYKSVGWASLALVVPSGGLLVSVKSVGSFRFVCYRCHSGWQGGLVSSRLLVRRQMAVLASRRRRSFPLSRWCPSFSSLAPCWWGSWAGGLSPTYITKGGATK